MAEQPGPDGGAVDDKDAPEQPGLSDRTKLILGLLAVIAVAAAAGWYSRHRAYGRFFQSTDDAQIRADAITIAPRVNGYVLQVLVADNQDVRAGQPLVRIDARNYSAQAAQAQAQIMQAQAGTDNARATIREQYATIAQAEAQLAAARVRAAHDAAEVSRYVPLASAGAESPQQLDQLRSTATQSADDARAQTATLLAQRRRITSLRTQVQQSAAQEFGGRAQLAASNVDVDATLLRAAAAGRVGDKTVTVGQYVQSGTALMSIVPLDRMYVVANFKETQLALMRPGQPAMIKVDALDGTELMGHVTSVSPGTGAQFSLLPPQNATGNFTKIVQRVPVRIAIEATPDAYRLLVPGLSVAVAVDTRSARGELDQVKRQQRQLRAQGR